MSNPNWKCETLTNNKWAKNSSSIDKRIRIEQKVKERTIYNRSN